MCIYFPGNLIYIPAHTYIYMSHHLINLNHQNYNYLGAYIIIAILSELLCTRNACNFFFFNLCGYRGCKLCIHSIMFLSNYKLKFAISNDSQNLTSSEISKLYVKPFTNDNLTNAFYRHVLLSTLTLLMPHPPKIKYSPTARPV